MGVVGAALRGFGKALRKHRIKHGGRGKDIKSVPPMSGKIPPYIGAAGKDLKKRAEIVKTWSKVKKIDKIAKHEKQIREGKTGLKKMIDTGQAKEFKDYKGKGTGGKGGTGTFIIIGGTGKYENITGSGFSSRQNIRGKAGMAHSMNQMSGEYTY